MRLAAPSHEAAIATAESSIVVVTGPIAQFIEEEMPLVELRPLSEVRIPHLHLDGIADLTHWRRCIILRSFRFFVNSRLFHLFQNDLLERNGSVIGKHVRKAPDMRSSITFIVLTAAGILSVSTAHAACTGTNGRGWGKGNGNGQFEMTASDKNCRISFPGFIDDVRKTRTPATDVTITRKPAKGSVSVVAGKGLVYTPGPNFKGKDRFCTKNRSAKIKGKTLSGCITVTVR